MAKTTANVAETTPKTPVPPKGSLPGTGFPRAGLPGVGPGDRDADRVARMGGPGRREPNVTGMIARRINHRASAGGGSGKRGNGRGATVFGRTRRTQRVVVKTHIARHRPGRASGLLRGHVSYLARDGAGLDGQPGRFYDAHRDDADAREAVRAWADDRHYFRFIVSPERGHDLPDLRAYVRELMRRVERDLAVENASGTTTHALAWHAINHHDTDNAHAHVMLRGKRGDGRDLVIDRGYVAHGMRARAEELATEILGERGVDEIERELQQAVTAERFTLLDRMIERRAEGGVVRVSDRERLGFTDADHRAAQARLQFLSTLGLATRERGGRWRLDPDWRDRLLDLGQRNDVIKALHATLGRDAARVRRVHAEAGSGAIPGVVPGVVVDAGRPDELAEDRYVVVRDARGELHYGRVADDPASRAVRRGSLVTLGRGVAARRELAETIVRVAEANGGVYRAEDHAEQLRDARPDRSAQAVERAVAAHVRRLESLSRLPLSGVRGLEGGGYRVDAPRLLRFGTGASRSARTDLTLHAAQSLEEQAQAAAWTWLDRQMYHRTEATRHGHTWTPPPTIDAAAFEAAAAQRRDWLVGQGYARRHGGRFLLRPRAAQRLRAMERRALANRLRHRGVRRVVGVPSGASIEGRYEATHYLHAGPHVAVRRGDTLHLAPVQRAPSHPLGTELRVTVTSRGVTRVQRARTEERSR